MKLVTQISRPGDDQRVAVLDLVVQQVVGRRASEYALAALTSAASVSVIRAAAPCVVSSPAAWPPAAHQQHGLERGERPLGWGSSAGEGHCRPMSPATSAAPARPLRRGRRRILRPGPLQHAAATRAERRHDRGCGRGFQARRRPRRARRRRRARAALTWEGWVSTVRSICSSSGPSR